MFSGQSSVKPLWWVLKTADSDFWCCSFQWVLQKIFTSCVKYPIYLDVKLIMQLQQLCKHASARFSSKLIDGYVVIGYLGMHPILCPPLLSFLPSLPLVTKASLPHVIQALYWATSLTPLLLRFHHCLAVGYIKTRRLHHRKGGIRPRMSFRPPGDWEWRGQSL